MEADKEEPPVTIRNIEPWMEQKQIEAFEKKSSRWYKEEQISDMELCAEIDSEVQRLRKSSYVHLSHEDKMAISTKIRMRHSESNITSEQFARCFGGWE